MPHTTNPAVDDTVPVPRDQLQLAFILANRAVVADVQTQCVCVWSEWPGEGKQRCYDTRPMLDPREHAPEVIDMVVQALSYGEWAGVLVRHPAARYLVRVVEQQPTTCRG